MHVDPGECEHDSALGEDLVHSEANVALDRRAIGPLVAADPEGDLEEHRAGAEIPEIHDGSGMTRSTGMLASHPEQRTLGGARGREQERQEQGARDALEPPTDDRAVTSLLARACPPSWRRA